MPNDPKYLSKIKLNNEEYNLKDADARSGLEGKQDVIDAEGFLVGDGSGNITAATTATTSTLGIDTTVTASSGNLVTSGAVAAAIAAVENEGALTEENDPIFSASAAAGITSTDISNWNAKVSDTGNWNDVALTKTSQVTQSNIYIPYLASTSETGANLVQAVADTTGNNAANRIPKYNNSGYLVSTTPTSGDNTTKVATTAFVSSAISALGSVLNYKGTKTAVSGLPATNNVTGDVWIVTADNSEHVWNGSSWEQLGTTVDLSGYLQSSDIADWAKASTKPSYIASEVGAAASTHTHGQIQNNGTLQTNDVSIGNGDKIVITDANSTTANQVVRSGITFDGSTTNKYLSPKGTWENVPTASSLGALTSESDPVFIQSAAYGITSTDISNWNAKQNALTAGTDYQTPLVAGTDYQTPLTIDSTPTDGNTTHVVSSDGTYDKIMARTKIYTASCSTTASTAAKVATLNDSSGYSLATGVMVLVRFTNGNSAGTPTLRVDGSSTGTAKTIVFKTDVTTQTTGAGTTYNTWGSNEAVLFIYDGTYWVNTGSGLGIYNAYNHVYGNIQTSGTLQTNDITIANGDKLVVTDSSDSDKVARTSLSFDGSTTNQFLSKKGTWESAGSSLPDQTDHSGDVLSTDGDDPYWKDTITVSKITIDSTPISNSTNLVTSGGIYSAVNSILPSQSGNSGKVLSTNGTTTQWNSVESASIVSIDSAPESGSTHLVTSGGVYSAITNADKTFIATYNTTTYADTLVAFNAGKTPVCKVVDGYFTRYVPLLFYNSQAEIFRFCYNSSATSHMVSKVYDLESSGWSYQQGGTIDLNRLTNVDDADTNYSTPMVRAIYAGTTDMVDGTTSLTSGTIYLVY